MTTSIKELNLLPVRWTVLDADGDPVTPSTIRYRVDCLTTGTQVIGWTSVSPAYTVNITIPATSNTILNPANVVETKRVTFQADAGTATALHDWEDYEIVNNRFVA